MDSVAHSNWVTEPESAQISNQAQDKGDRSLSPGVPANWRLCMNEAGSVAYETLEPSAMSLDLGLQLAACSLEPCTSNWIFRSEQ